MGQLDLLKIIRIRWNHVDKIALETITQKGKKMNLQWARFSP